MKKSAFAFLAVVAFSHWPMWASAQVSRLPADRALGRALENGDRSAAASALKSGANPNALLIDSVLTTAVRSNDPALVELILKAGADPNRCPHDTTCPLAGVHVGYGSPRVNEEANRETITALLLRAGADPNGSPNDDMSPLHRAIQQGRPRIALLLLEAGAHPQGRTHEGAPLKEALRRSENALAGRLVAAGATLDPDPVLLEAVAEKGNAQGLGIAIRLMRRSTGKRKLDLSGALGAATREDCAACVRLLAAAGARYKLDAAYRVNYTTTWFEVIGGAGAEVLAVYAAHGLDPRAVDAKGTTLLHLAAELGKGDSVKWLLARGVPINARQSRTLRTPLMAAAEAGNVKAVGALLDAGADSALLDTWGNTAKVLAAQANSRASGHDAVVRLLHQRGALEYEGPELPASPFAAELAGKTQHDVTGGFYRQLPFLKPGLRFFGAFVPLPEPYMTPEVRPAPEGTVYAVLPGRKVVKLARPVDLLSLGMRLRSEDDALRLVRVYTDPGYAHGAWFRARFERMGYWELPETDRCIAVTGWKGSRKPSIRRVATAHGTHYVVSRTMIPNFLIRGGEATVDEVIQTTETVREDGAYALEIRVVASPGLVVRRTCFPR